MNISKTNIDRKAAKFSAAAFALTETILAMTLGAVMLSAMYSSFASGICNSSAPRFMRRLRKIIARSLMRSTRARTSSSIFPLWASGLSRMAIACS